MIPKSSSPKLVKSRQGSYEEIFISSLSLQCEQYVLNQYSPNSASPYSGFVIRIIIPSRNLAWSSVGSRAKIYLARGSSAQMYACVISLSSPFARKSFISEGPSARISLWLILQIVGDWVRMVSFLLSPYPWTTRRNFSYGLMFLPLTSRTSLVLKSLWSPCRSRSNLIKWNTSRAIKSLISIISNYLNGSPSVIMIPSSRNLSVSAQLSYSFLLRQIWLSSRCLGICLGLWLLRSSVSWSWDSSGSCSCGALSWFSMPQS